MLDTVEQAKPAMLKELLHSKSSSRTTLTLESNHEEIADIVLPELEKKIGLDLVIEDDIPDGGWQAWSVIFGLFWMYFFTFGSVNSFGVYEQYYAKHLLPDKTMSQIAWIGAFQFFFVFALGIIAGRLFDMGIIKPVLGAASVMLVFCQLMTSLCTTYWQLFLAQGVGMGISMGLIVQVCLSIPSQWFKKRRAGAMGILASSAGLGATVQPIYVKKVIPIVGFAWTMRIMAFACAIAFTGCFFLIKTRVTPRPSTVKASKYWIDLEAFKRKSYTLFVIGAFFIMLGLYVPQTYMNTFTAQYHIRGDGYWLSVLNASSILGRLLPGFLADRYGKMTVVIPHLCIASVLLFLFPLFNNLSMIAFTILFGYCSGAWISLAPVSVIQLGPMHTVGSRMGALFSFMSIAGLFGTPLAGLILGEIPYRWWPTVAFSGSCCSIGLIFVLFARHFAAHDLPFRP